MDSIVSDSKYRTLAHQFFGGLATGRKWPHVNLKTGADKSCRNNESMERIDRNKPGKDAPTYLGRCLVCYSFVDHFDRSNFLGRFQNLKDGSNFITEFMQILSKSVKVLQKGKTGHFTTRVKFDQALQRLASKPWVLCTPCLGAGQRLVQSYREFKTLQAKLLSAIALSTAMWTSEGKTAKSSDDEEDSKPARLDPKPMKQSTKTIRMNNVHKIRRSLLGGKTSWRKTIAPYVSSPPGTRKEEEETLSNDTDKIYSITDVVQDSIVDQPLNVKLEPTTTVKSAFSGTLQEEAMIDGIDDPFCDSPGVDDMEANDLEEGIMYQKLKVSDMPVSNLGQVAADAATPSIVSAQDTTVELNNAGTQVASVNISASVLQDCNGLSIKLEEVVQNSGNVDVITRSSTVSDDTATTKCQPLPRPKRKYVRKATKDPSTTQLTRKPKKKGWKNPAKGLPGTYRPLSELKDGPWKRWRERYGGTISDPEYRRRRRKDLAEAQKVDPETGFSGRTGVAGAIKNWKIVNGKAYFRGIEMVKNSEGLYTCPCCTKFTSSKRNGITRHISYFHVDTSHGHPCEYCDEKFYSQNQLKEHVQEKHFGGYQCHICGLQLSNRSSLHAHKKVKHEGIKKHICEHCGKSFASKKDLSIHVRRHTGERPFVCQVCADAFIDKQLLKKHLRSKHPEVPEEDPRWNKIPRITIPTKGTSIKGEQDQASN